MKVENRHKESTASGSPYDKSKEVMLMSTIRQYAAGNSFYESMYGTNSNAQSNSFLSGLNMNADTGSTFSLSDYAMIKNGTYGK